MLNASVRIRLYVSALHPVKTGPRGKVLGLHEDLVNVTLFTLGAGKDAGKPHNLFEDSIHRSSVPAAEDDGTDHDEADRMTRMLIESIEDTLGVDLDLTFFEGLAADLRQLLVGSGGMR